MICTTRNRFSLSTEPHVGVWGVGFLPRRWMARYVRWRAGKEYRHTHLLSLFELRALFRRVPRLAYEIRAPRIWEGNLARFSRLKRGFARSYNSLLGVPLARLALLVVAPFFVVAGRKLEVQILR